MFSDRTFDEFCDQPPSSGLKDMMLMSFLAVILLERFEHIKDYMNYAQRNNFVYMID